MKNKIFPVAIAFLFACCFVGASDAKAELVLFNFMSGSGTAGNAFHNTTSGSMFSSGGVDLTMATGIGDKFFSSATGGGVGSGGDKDSIESGEFLKFTFDFTAPSNQLTSIIFTNPVQQNANTATIRVQILRGIDVKYETTTMGTSLMPNFDLEAGDMIRFTADSASYRLKQFSVSAVPEPTSLLMFGLAVASGLGFRRRKM